MSVAGGGVAYVEAAAREASVPTLFDLLDGIEVDVAGDVTEPGRGHEAAPLFEDSA